MEIFNIIILMTSDLLILTFIISSIIEKEYRAALLCSAALILNTVLWSIFILYNDYNYIFYANIFSVSTFCFFTLISLVKTGFKKNIYPVDIEQYDERDHMFSRNNLKNSPENRLKYYKLNPDKKKLDEEFLKLPDIGEPGGIYYNEIMMSYLNALKEITEETSGLFKINKNKHKKKISPEIITDLLKKMAFHIGADDVGITKLRKYHVYSHSGRHSENWGKPIKTDHRYAIVIILRMNIKAIKAAPGLPVVLETCLRYLEVAKIAHIISNFIKNLGYEARAQFDANYQVVCVPLARDAGLGALGRLGVLMHPRYGPCVRISAVTTEMDLVPDRIKSDYGYIESFCRICKKCSENCPTNSIQSEDMKKDREFYHWSINQERCYTFWRKIGTDCAFCIRVCPFTKPNTLIHRLARFYISRNHLNQRIALFLDNALYGRRMNFSQSNFSTNEIMPSIKCL